MCRQVVLEGLAEREATLRRLMCGHKVVVQQKLLDEAIGPVRNVSWRYPLPDTMHQLEKLVDALVSHEPMAVQRGATVELAAYVDHDWRKILAGRCLGLQCREFRRRLRRERAEARVPNLVGNTPAAVMMANPLPHMHQTRLSGTAKDARSGGVDEGLQACSVQVEQGAQFDRVHIARLDMRVVEAVDLQSSEERMLSRRLLRLLRCCENCPPAAGLSPPM